MNGLEFLRLVLPPRGWYVGFATKPDQRPLQQSFQTLEGLLAWLARLERSGYTVYYACAAFRDRQVWDAKQQKFVQRTHANILCIANLWADVDTQESHATAKYVDREDAAQAVEAFRRHMELPPPLWISSGGGVHVHWPWAVELELAEWEVYSRGLRTAAHNFGLDIDARKTLDGSAVLRVPGFHNLKFDPPRLIEAGPPVPRYPLDQFEKLKEIGLASAPRSRPVESAARSDSPIAAALIGTIYDDPSDPRAAARLCAQLGAFVAEPGKFSEPFHRGVAGHCKVSCADGGDIYLSWLAPEYRDAGQIKLDGYRLDSPPTCAYFENASPHPELCKACPHYGKITAPIQLGRLAEKKIERLAQARVTASQSSAQPGGREASAAGAPIQFTTASEAPSDIGEDAGLNGFPILKPPWNLNANGEIVFEYEDPKTQQPIEKVVADHPIYAHGIYGSEADVKRVSYAFRHKVHDEPWQTITLPAFEWKAGRGIAHLADGGALIRDNAKFVDYANEQLGKLDKAGKRGIRYEQNGFKNGNRDFLCGTKLYKLGGPVCEAIVSDEIMARVKLGLGLRPGADVREYLAAYNRLFDSDHYCAHLNYALSGGSIFHPWLTRSAGGLIIINWTPASARGKSMILWACGAMWSSSRHAMSIKDFDTLASQGLILAALGNLPVLIDEINHFGRDPQYGVTKLREIIEKIANGFDKNRAKQQGTGVQFQAGTFGQHAVCSSNEDVSDRIIVTGGGDAAEAATKRLLMLDGRPPRAFDQSQGDALEALLWNNGGAVGDAFLRHLQLEHVHSYTHQLLDRNVEQMWKNSRLAADHRIRMRAYSAAKTFAEVALDIGLWPVAGSRQHIEDTFGWGVEQIKARTATATETEPKDAALQLLDDYLRSHANNTLRVEWAYKRHMHQAALGQRPQRLIVRYERGTARIYTPTRDLRAFVVGRGSSWRDFLQGLKDHQILITDRRKMTLGAGTEYSGNSAQVDCVELDASHPALGDALQASSGDENVDNG